MARITVIGLGYIGLPTAAMFATHGHTVSGYDVNPAIVRRLRAGDIHIEEPGLLAFVRSAVHAGAFTPTDTLEPADAYVICVPTPHNAETKRADLAFVETAARALVPLLKKGDLVVLESTVPARTTSDVLVPILEKSGLSCTTDVHVAHCPETVLPGNMIHELANNHRIIGGHTPEATAAARDLYASFVRADILTTDATTAEFVKLIENSYRDVNIALANEIAVIAHEFGIDAREAIAIANKHPRVKIHQPGPGVGGHCIPVDPWFIITATPNAKLLRAAREVNDAMPGYVVREAERMLAGTAAPKIALFGLAYKGNVDDTRESPSFEVARLAKERIPNVTVAAHDPHVPPERHESHPLDEALNDADCLIIATDHREFKRLNPAIVAKLVRTRNVIDARGMLDAGAWRAAGFVVRRV